MLPIVKTHTEKTREFVKKHQTLVACTTTAAVTWRIAYKTALKGAILGITDTAYEWGQKNGVLTLQNNVLLAFINDNGLDDQVREYIKNLK